jgi:TPR repeat protein
MAVVRPLTRPAALLCLLLAAAAPATAGDFPSGLSAYNSGDFAGAYRAWRPLAEQGDAAAQAGLGFLIHRGLGVAADDAAAAQWFARAAEQGQAEAQLLLGSLFFFGEGVPQNYAMAFAWCEIAQTDGQSDAAECRDAALEHLSEADAKRSFRVVARWFAQHPHPDR